MESIEIEMNFPAPGQMCMALCHTLAAFGVGRRTGGASHCASHMVTTVPDNFFDRVHLPGVDLDVPVDVAVLAGH